MADGKVGMGHPDPNHPSNRYDGDDQALVDYDGELVVNAAGWSKVPTGLYLSVFVSRISTPLHPDRRFHYETLGLKGGELTVGTSKGKPTFQAPGWGLSLELPSDLARDDLKKKYVMEWLVATIGDCLLDSGIKVPGGKAELDGLAHWVHDVAERSIRKVGL